MTVKSKIISLIAASIILPILIISLLIINNLRSHAVETFEHQAHAEISHIDETFSLFLNNLAENAAFFAQSDALTELTPGSITSYANAPAGKMTPTENSEFEQRAFALMDDFGKTHPDLTYIWFGTNDSGYLQWPTGNNTANYDPLERGWYKNFTEARTPTRVPAYADAGNGAPLIDYVQRFDGENGLYGVVGVDVSLAKLTELLSTVKFGGEGYLVMVEDTETVLADPSDPENNFKPITDASRPYAELNDEGSVQKINIDGEAWFAQVYISPDLGWKFIGLLPAKVVYAQSNQLITNISLIALVMVAIFIAIGTALSSIVIRPIKVMADRLRDIGQGEGDLTQRLKVTSNDEPGQMAKSFNLFVSSIDSIVGRTKDSCKSIGQVADQTDALSTDLSNTVESQLNSVDQVSTAFNEMVSTANEVANNCTTAAQAAEAGEQQVQQGNNLIKRTMASLSSLEAEIQSSNESLVQLAEESDNIVSILDTIKGIAEQTNLLALNAAIEAARAGEQGRGFAVVADEVRTLAGRTAESTDEIDRILTSLQQQTKSAVEKMDSSVEVTKESVNHANETAAIFETILSSVLSIKDMTIQISATAEEQHLVAEDINKNVVNIHDDVQSTNELSTKVSQAATELNTLAKELQGMVEHFKSSDDNELM